MNNKFSNQISQSKVFKYSRGFTLIELLVVIAIIGVLAAIIIPNIGVARTKARDAQRIAELKGIQSSLIVYADDNGGQYPVDINDLVTTKIVKTLPTNFGATGVDKYTYVPLYYNGTAYSACSATSGATNPCNSYQLSASLERDNAVLRTDADISASTITSNGITGVEGNQATGESGCSAGTRASCIYDLSSY